MFAVSVSCMMETVVAYDTFVFQLLMQLNVRRVENDAGNETTCVWYDICT